MVVIVVPDENVLFFNMVVVSQWQPCDEARGCGMDRLMRSKCGWLGVLMSCWSGEGPTRHNNKCRKGKLFLAMLSCQEDVDTGELLLFVIEAGKPRESRCRWWVDAAALTSSRRALPDIMVDTICMNCSNVSNQHINDNNVL